MQIVETRPSMVNERGHYLRCAPGPHPWREIGSEPTDGTPFLICWAGGHWDPAIAFNEDGRYGSINSDMSIFWHDKPTHWMPLPAPPSKTTE